MHAHFVLAHPERRSYNGHLMDLGIAALERGGWSTSVSDLYAMGFDPCERGDLYARRANPARFDAQAEQQHATETKTLPAVVMEELGRLDRADLVVFQYPLWWHLPPAILKGYFDRVFAYQEVYAGKRRFEAGRFAGKRALLSVTVGTSENTYRHDGRSGDIDLLLWPVNFSLVYVGFTILNPIVAYGVEGVLRYSPAAEVEARLKAFDREFSDAMTSIGDRPTIPFNRMAEWGADGRIVPGAPVYSPFIRRKKDLALE